MTAIFGLWRFDGGEVARDLRRMDQALARYGGDDHESWSTDPGLAMGRHLHSAVPEDRFGMPPAGPAQRYIVAGDVRLTEREDLARQLNLGGEAARMSDAAIAAAAIEAWHEQAFDRIYGAFAIAAWDRRERRLLLARDHLGQKPLFFHRADRFFAFASMPGGLHALAEVPRGPDIESVKRFLALENHGAGKTHYEGIERIMPGHYAIVTSGGFTETRYWKPDLTRLRLPTSDDYASALAEHLDRAVAAALRGVETQVGAHLSSGFDSTTVATTAAVQLASRGGTVVAYTAAPREGYDKHLPDRLADESVLAKATAAMHPNMRHVVIRSERTPMANLNRTASIYGVPVLNIVNETWVDAINDDAADRGITIMLEGVTGNATISETGMLALPELVRSGRIISWLKLVRRLAKKGAVGWQPIIWNSFNTLIPDGLYRWVLGLKYGAMATPANYSGLKPEHWHAATLDAERERAASAPKGRVSARVWTRPNVSSLEHRLTLLAPDDNGPSCKGMLGEWKIDYRDPTADRRLVEFSLRVPAEQLIHDGRPRSLLRKILADRVPREVLENPLKGYQAADWHEWLDRARQEVTDEIARIEKFEPSAEIIDVDRLKALVDNWPESGSDAWTQYEVILDYRCCLLRAVSAASFMRQASGSNH